MGRFYITTPIYYVNAKPHIGHAYTEIACDTLARYRKQHGDEVFFLTGTDEHGEKIEKATIEAGFAAGEEKKFVDTIVPHFKELWSKLDIEYDRFIRTTDSVHEKAVQKFLSVLYANGKIYKKIYRGWFCAPCEAFWSNSQVADGFCPDCSRKVEELDEENYFLKISEYRDELLAHIKANPGFIRPEMRRNEVMGFLEHNELQDLCISRPKSRLRWGIELPFDTSYVAYVWLDALINYISAIGYSEGSVEYKALWPSAWHMVGKDILRHHTVYWPIMLLAAGEKPPRGVFAHGWWVMGGEKMSKSKGNVVDPMAMIDRYGVESFRYYLLSTVQFGHDGTFSEKLFIEKFNSDLANDLGNLISRSLSMIEKYFAGEVPSPGTPGLFEPLESGARNLGGQLDAAFAEWDFSAALRVIMDLVKSANKYIEERAPWKLSKANDSEALKSVMYALAETIGAVTVALYPFLPGTARAIWAQAGMTGDVSRLTLHGEGAVAGWGIVPPGTRTQKAAILFPRIETVTLTAEK